MMKLYYSPGACSLAPHIALCEAEIPVTLVKVDLASKKYDGGDFTKINPKGYVPVLELDNGQILTEAAILLQYIADQKPEKNLIPKFGTFDRYRCLEWIHFISTEFHKTFSPLFRDTTPDETRRQSRATLEKRYGYLDAQLADRQFLMGQQFTVADAYLFTVSGWARHVKFDLSPWKSVTSYLERVGARPHVREALKAEGLLKDMKDL